MLMNSLDVPYKLILPSLNALQNSTDGPFGVAEDNRITDTGGIAPIPAIVLDFQDLKRK
jgi:hypothetical protein